MVYLVSLVITILSLHDEIFRSAFWLLVKILSSINPLLLFLVCPLSALSGNYFLILSINLNQRFCKEGKYVIREKPLLTDSTIYETWGRLLPEKPRSSLFFFLLSKRFTRATAFHLTYFHLTWVFEDIVSISVNVNQFYLHEVNKSSSLVFYLKSLFFLRYCTILGKKN